MPDEEVRAPDKDEDCRPVEIPLSGPQGFNIYERCSTIPGPRSLGKVDDNVKNGRHYW